MTGAGEVADSVLSVEGVTHQFGGIKAIDDCTWTLARGRLAALIGPNGAGKSTLINVVCGAYRLQTGVVKFDGVETGGWPPHRLAQRGLVRTFQVARVFDDLTVLENLLFGAPNQPGESFAGAVLWRGRARRVEREVLARANELVNTFDLFRLRNDYGRELSGGQRRLLELARALMAEPKVLMLDEPMAGINPALAERIGEHLQAIRSQGVTLLLVEHNLAVVDRLCDWVTVMAEGRVLASGSMEELRSHPGVIAAYLGREGV